MFQNRPKLTPRFTLAVVEEVLAELASVQRVANGMWLTEAISTLDANQSCFESLGQFLSDSIIVLFRKCSQS